MWIHVFFPFYLFLEQLLNFFSQKEHTNFLEMKFFTCFFFSEGKKCTQKKKSKKFFEKRGETLKEMKNQKIKFVICHFLEFEKGNFKKLESR